MSGPGIDTRGNEHVVLPLLFLRDVVEALAGLGHGHAAHDLTDGDEDEAEGDGVATGPAGLPAGEQDGRDGHLQHGARVGQIVRCAVAEQKVAAHLCVGRVPARRGVEFEKVEQRQRDQEGGQAPDAVALVGKVQRQWHAETQSDTQQEAVQ